MRGSGVLHSKWEVINCAREECLKVSPYGKRYAVSRRISSDPDQIIRNPDTMPQRDFTPEHEQAYKEYIESAEALSAARGELFTQKFEGAR